MGKLVTSEGKTEGELLDELQEWSRYFLPTGPVSAEKAVTYGRLDRHVVLSKEAVQNEGTP